MEISQNWDIFPKENICQSYSKENILLIPGTEKTISKLSRAKLFKIQIRQLNTVEKKYRKRTLHLY